MTAPSTEAHLSALTAALPDGYVVPVVAWANDRPRIVATAGRTDLAAALGAVTRYRDDLNLYVNTCAVAESVVPTLVAERRRGREDEAAAAIAVFADIDIAGPGHKSQKRLPSDMSAALEVLDDLPEASMVVATGGGLHAWWLLDEPWIITDDNRANVRALTDGWVRTVARHAGRLGWEIDDGVGDLARVLRLVGTLNQKTTPPRRSGLVAVGGWPPGGLLEHGWLWRPGVRYRPADLVAVLDPLPKGGRRDRSTSVVPTPLRRSGDQGLNILNAVNAAPWSDIWPPDWELVGSTTVAGEHVELWRRPGASSDYSAKCWPDGGCQVWSDAIPGLGGGTDGRHSKADVLAWRHGLDLSGLSKLIIREAREAMR